MCDACDPTVPILSTISGLWMIAAAARIQNLGRVPGDEERQEGRLRDSLESDMRMTMRSISVKLEAWNLHEHLRPASI